MNELTKTVLFILLQIGMFLFGYFYMADRIFEKITYWKEKRQYQNSGEHLNELGKALLESYDEALAECDERTPKRIVNGIRRKRKAIIKNKEYHL